MLGVALDSRLVPAYAGRAPFDVEGEDMELAGRVTDACETLVEFRSLLTVEQTIESYCALVSRLVDEVFFVERDLMWQKTEICDSLREFCRTAIEAGFVANISFYSLLQALKTRFEPPVLARSFLSGGVTFCKMLPLRSIPFRIIVLVGLEDGQFPRRNRNSSFNALNQDARSGDRNVREEDRFLFAESLLACRERFIVTYVGRSSLDDSARPPSIVIEELLCAIDESFQPISPDRKCPRELVHHVEALQPFSPRYFDGSSPHLINRSTNHYRAALALSSPQLEPTIPNYACPALPQVGMLRHRDLTELLRNPTRVYLEKSLGLAVDPKLQLHDSTEPITLDALAEWRITRELLEARLQGRSEQLTVERLRAAGELPSLGLGEVAIDSLRRRGAGLLAAASPWCKGSPLDDQWVSLTINGVQLEGWIDSNWPSAHLYLRPSRIAPASIVEAWVEHLFINAAGSPIATVVVARAAQGQSVVTREFAPLPSVAAREQLASLIQDYQLALAVPLPFWLGPAQVYYDARTRAHDHASALARAKEELELLRDAGKLDSHFEVLYGRDPCASEWPALAGVPQVPCFAQWAERWLGPIHNASTVDTSVERAEPSS
jgi:exodeoxyribonuclease V gamma subunit